VRGICEKYQSKDETFPESNAEGNLVSRLVFSPNTPPKHDISMLDSDWLIAVVFFFLQIQALHYEFAEFLLHVGVFA
jgi:hypothetical protein